MIGFGDELVLTKIASTQDDTVNPLIIANKDFATIANNSYHADIGVLQGSFLTED